MGADRNNNMLLTKRYTSPVPVSHLNSSAYDSPSKPSVRRGIERAGALPHSAAGIPIIYGHPTGRRPPERHRGTGYSQPPGRRPGSRRGHHLWKSMAHPAVRHGGMSQGQGQSIHPPYVCVNSLSTVWPTSGPEPVINHASTQRFTDPALLL